MKVSKRKILDQSLLLITIAISGMPYFSSAIFNAPLSIVLLAFFVIRRKKFDFVFFYLISFFVVVTGFQTIVFNFLPIETIVGAFLRIANGYLIVKILQENFIIYFVNIFFKISVISLCFFIPILLIPGLGESLRQIASLLQIFDIAGSEVDSLIFYTLHWKFLYRNPGPFWEAGAFAGFVILALVFNTFIENKNKKLKQAVFVATIFSTFSTTAYLALMIFAFLYYYRSIKNIFLKGFLVSLISLFSYFAFVNISFLSEKIFLQASQAVTQDAYKDTDNSARFFSALRDFQDIKGYEITGRGWNPKTRYSAGEETQIRTVGMTDILVKMGVPYFLFMFFVLHRSVRIFLKYYNNNHFLNYNTVFLMIILTLMSQSYFNFPIYWSFLFMSCAYKEPFLKKT